MTLHIINRGHNAVPIFDDDTDCEIFLNAVRKASIRWELDVHAFALMKNHYHLQVTPRLPSSVAKAIGECQSRYSRYYKRKHDRIGSIWNGRYKPVPVESAWQWLVCLRYIVLNPVRAKLVDDPAAYRWTSYAAHAMGSGVYPWLTDHAILQDLAETPQDRQSIFKELCASSLSEAELTLMRDRRCAKLVGD